MRVIHCPARSPQPIARAALFSRERRWASRHLEHIGASKVKYREPRIILYVIEMAAASSSDYKHDRRCIIYPSYINSKCTVQQGRRIPKEAACEAPNVLEIRDVLEKSMKLPCEVEDKSYSRDFWQRGRVRVTIKKEDGSPIAKEFPTRKVGTEKKNNTARF